MVEESRTARGRLLLDLICVGWVLVIWLWPPAHLALTVDDSFYYLRISEHIAAGRGPTFDGVERTNGFQPLWMGVLSVLALLPVGPETAMRVSLSAGLVLVRAASALLSRIEPRVDLAAAVLMASFWFTKVLINGMESSLVALLIAACLLAPEKARAGWGAVAGLLVLARLDAVFFVAPWLVRRPRAIAGVCAVLVPWAALWLWSFDHLMPVSGAVKHGGVPAEAWVALGIALAGAWLTKHWRLWPLVAYALSVVVIGGWFEIWRLLPIAMVVLLLFARVPTRSFAIASSAWLAFAGVTWVHRIDPVSYTAYEASRRSGVWIREHTPPDAVVAGWDCGIAAAHSERTFYQLEGLVGSWRFYEELRSGRTAEWVDAQRVGWIAQSFSVNDPELVIDGVDLGAWRVARAECVEFRSIVSPMAATRRVYAVLRRDGVGQTLAERLGRAEPCR